MTPPPRPSGDHSCPDGRTCTALQELRREVAKGNARLEALEASYAELSERFDKLDSHLGSINDALTKVVAELKSHAACIGSAGDGLPEGRPPSGLVGMLIALRSDAKRLRDQVEASIRPKLDSLMEEEARDRDQTREQLLQRVHRAEAELDSERKRIALEERTRNEKWKEGVTKALMWLAAGAGGAGVIERLWETAKHIVSP